MDVIAVTEHIEYRPFDKEFGDYLQADHTKDRDLNTSVRHAQKEGAYWDIFIIPGTEITRSGRYVGHFNALFTVDNNEIYDEDPVQAIRIAMTMMIARAIMPMTAEFLMERTSSLSMAF